MGQTKTKGLRIATRCTSIDQFVATFHRFCDAQTVFISTLSTRPIGLETPFSIDLADNAPALRGLGIVVEAWSTSKNPYGRPGLQLGIRRLTADSEPVFERLIRAHEAATLASQPPIPASSTVVVRMNVPRAAPTAIKTPPAPVRAVEPRTASPATEPLSTEAPRTPGSELVLPANPLMGLDDQSLEGFVDCTLYEETANFFPIAEPLQAEDPDSVVEPPPPATPRRPGTTAMIALASPLHLDVPSHASTSMAAATRAPLPVASSNLPASAAVVGTKVTFAPPALPVPRLPRTAPPMPVQARPATEPAEPIEIEPDTMSDARALPDSAVGPPELWPTDHRPAGPTDPSSPPVTFYPPASFHPPAFTPLPEHPHQPPAPVSRWETARARGAQLVTGPRRWWVLGAAGVLAIIVALAVSRSSTPASAATDTSHELVAVNTPRDQARISKPITDSRTPKADVVPHAAEPDSSTASDVGTAPVFGSGPCKIAVSSTPAGSIITVDGEQAGPSPITIGGPCKPRKIDIAHPRYQAATRTVTGKPETELLEVTLARPTHDLYVDTQPSGATISIDGHRAGTSPTMVKIMGFTTLTLTIEKPGFKPQTKKLYSKAAQDRQSIKLAPTNKGKLSDLVRAKL